MARFEHNESGVVVSVDDAKADRFGAEWKSLDDEKKAPARKRPEPK